MNKPNEGSVLQSSVKQLPEINGLKGLLCICIFFEHYYSRLCASTPELTPSFGPIRLYQYGFLAVEFFFCISGFLSALAYKDRDYPFFVYLRRRLRFYPKIIVSIVFCLLIYVFDQIILDTYVFNTELTFYRVLRSFLLVTNWVDNSFPISGVVWYVDVLVICFCVYYFICRMGKRRHDRYLLLCLFMVITGYSCIRKSPDFPFLYQLNGRGYLSFFVGVLLYDILQMNIPKKVYWSLFFVVLGLFALIQFSGMTYIGDHYVVFGLFVCPVCLASVIKLNFLKKLFSLPPFQALGKISFAFYLLHQNIIDGSKLIKAYYSLPIDYSSNTVLLCILLICLAAASVFEALFQRNSEKKAT